MSRLYLRLPNLPSFHHAITSFLGFMDLKIGAQILTLFALFNKTAGVYGIIAVFQGGTLTQVALYIYSIATIVIFLWGLKAISDENPQQVLTYAHLFTLDHMISTFWTLLFGINWYVFTPHDGRPTTNQSSHQTGLMDLIESIEKQYQTPEMMAKLHHEKLTEQQRKISAEKIWAQERGFATMVLVFGWFIKIYFALVIYSFALHLRHGTYRNLALSKVSTTSGVRSEYRYHTVTDDLDEPEGWSDGEDETTVPPSSHVISDSSTPSINGNATTPSTFVNKGGDDDTANGGVQAVVDRLAYTSYKNGVA